MRIVIENGHSPETVLIDYTNWRGERGTRRIYPITLQFGENKWHKTPQWLLSAVDLDKNELRTFALGNIHSWKALGP